MKSASDPRRRFTKTSDLLPVATHESAPDPAGILAAISRIGYSLPESIADIVDNSIDAGARHVLVRFLRTPAAITGVAIVDDGSGMDERTLDHAMRFGVKVAHKTRDLGKYGIGLKAASFSHCRMLTVVSKQGRDLATRRWTVESIRRGWELETPAPDVAHNLFVGDWQHVDPSSSGTLVLLEDLPKLKRTAGSVDEIVDAEISRLMVHLGLHFHRFLERERLTITLDVFDENAEQSGPPQRAAALDPFGYPETGKTGYPRRFAAQIEQVGVLDLDAHIWPPKLRVPNYTLGGGKVAERQGFYFYRNERLIQAGGWNGWLKSNSEPHLSLARVAVELPTQFDEAFSLNVQKSAIDVPPSFAAALERSRSAGRSLKDYLRDADAVYRSKSKHRDKQATVIGDGVGVRLQQRAKRLLKTPGRPRDVHIAWRPLPSDTFFELDRDSATLVINRDFRDTLLYGTRASSADAPVVKMLLFLLVQEELEGQRMSAKDKKRVALLNALLIEAVKSQDRALSNAAD